MAEPEEVGQRRNALKALEETLEAALAILNDPAHFTLRTAATAGASTTLAMAAPATSSTAAATINSAAGRRAPLHSVNNSSNKTSGRSNESGSASGSRHTSKLHQLAGSKVTARQTPRKENSRV